MTHPDFPTPESATKPLRVVVADDNPVVRAGLTALLSGREDIKVVAEAADGREAYEAARRHRPDVVLLDVQMPGVDGIAALPYLVKLAPVMMLTYSRESETVEEALRRGANGYLVHGEFTAAELVEAVRGLNEGKPHFTATAAEALLTQLRRSTDSHPHMEPPAPTPNKASPLSQVQPSMGQSSGRKRFQLSTREAEIMDLIASGMTNHQIAATCFISEKTVKNHINRIFAKLHSTTRAQATAKWLGVT
ncbi:two-component system response regulator [Streptomyces davaonensis JCM 4913]|uniref:Two-component system response regulator n=1 Tax=Streptomyces davaonensis (strain DSM 101723 / JCM 4913 / KCC S-0913 / 768) TaxID=1214101 RepID=K4R4W8_STRDJ|nr:response regulator transcription factor [Streptomyces davaonensis]CCK27764.1 two-component system response regulator [Streptomyces davaonensis JCM 4913]